MAARLRLRSCSRHYTSITRSSSCPSWYLTYKLSSRDLVSMVGERGTDDSAVDLGSAVRPGIREALDRWIGTPDLWAGLRCDETYVR